MGIFEKMFGKKKPRFSERIWLTAQGKMTDLLGQLRRNAQQGHNTVVVTHFQDSHHSLLEHPMLIQSIQSAQKRLARQVSREQVCASCQEWMLKNLDRKNR